MGPHADRGLVNLHGEPRLNMLAHMSTRSLKISVLVLLVILFPLRALADSQAPAVPRLAPGDRVMVTVVGQADLSGEFTVDGSGNINIPLAGTISATDATVSQIQARITERLADGYIRQPTIYVKVSEYRPVQILGDVKTPGSYSFRFGSIVKSVVAQAGGYGIAQVVPSVATSEFLIAEERLKTLIATRARLLVRQARLTAQLAGAETFEAPKLDEEITEDDAKNFVEQEMSALKAYSDAIAQQIGSFQAQKPQLLNESKAIDAQIASERKQLELVQVQIDEYNRLTEKGLGRTSALVELKLAIGTKESNVWQLEATRSRLQNTIMDLDSKINAIEVTRRKETMTELQDVRQKLLDAQMALPTARELRGVKLDQTSSAGDSSAIREFTITRVRNGEANLILAFETSSIEPGDIIEVKTKRMNSGRQTAATTGTEAVR